MTHIIQKISNNVVLEYDQILYAINCLNKNVSKMTLFVLNEKKQLVGTLTDGDIRRGFIKGLSLSGTVDQFMCCDFNAIRGYVSLEEFRKIRSKGIKLLPVLNEQEEIVKIYDLTKLKSILPLECMIMAGGRGERLRPLTESIPKPMLPLGGKPIIERNIDRLISYGVEKIYISVKYLGQQIVDYFGDGSSKVISIEYIWEDEPLGTAGALALVERFNTDHILLMNSDLFTDVDFEDLYLSLIDQNASMVVATVPYTRKVPYGIFEIERDHQIVGLQEKPTYTNYANAGIYIIETTCLEDIPKHEFFHITHLMEKLIAKNKKVIHNPITGYWIDIGQHQDYKNAMEIVKHLD